MWFKMKVFTMDGWATAKYQRDSVGTLRSPTTEVSYILIEDLPHIPSCVASHLEAKYRDKDKLPPIFPILHIGYDYIFVAKGHENDVLNPYLVEEKVIELGGGRPATFLQQSWSNGHTSMKKVEPSTDWMDDNWADPPQG